MCTLCINQMASKALRCGTGSCTQYYAIPVREESLKNTHVRHVFTRSAASGCPSCVPASASVSSAAVDTEGRVSLQFLVFPR